MDKFICKCRLHVCIFGLLITTKTKNIMKNLIRLFVGIITLPLFLILLFTVINFILSLITPFTFWEVQISVVWFLYFFIICIAISAYFTEYPVK